MSDIQIRVHGLDQYTGKLSRISANMPGELKKLTTKAVLYAQSEIPGYPPPPAGSTYRRTGTLGRAVTAAPGSPLPSLTRVESLGAGVRGVIGGRLDYIGYVIDANKQAWMHRGRWWTLQKVIQGARGGIEKIYRAGVLDLFK
jgi:hypothetical protein